MNDVCLHRQRYSGMDLLHIFLGLNLIAIVQGAVVSFGLKEGDSLTTDATVHLECVVNGIGGNTFIYITNLKDDPLDPYLSTCSKSVCLPDVLGRYRFTVLNNAVTVTITNLNREYDEKWWTCKSNPSELQLLLYVYAIPTSMTLESPSSCDLATEACSFSCTTDSCTYPVPYFIWYYSVDTDSTTYELLKIGTKVMDTQNKLCSGEEKEFIGTLLLKLNSIIDGNTQSALRLLCKIQFADVSTISLASNLSPQVMFAVKVSEVAIYDDQTSLTGSDVVTVNEFEEKSLKCTPGYGHPTPAIKWFIGNDHKSNDSVYRFIPTNSEHDKRIYCKTNNIPGDGVDVVSQKPKLNIKVKIKNVYIETAANSSISVIENIPEPVVCATSAGRPRSTIRWLKLVSNQYNDFGEGDNLDYVPTGYHLEITKSTKHITVSRQDSGWRLSCSASNFKGAASIKANDSKPFNVLYPPEQMSISDSGSSVADPSLDVIKGTNVTLHCSAVSNPPVVEFSWNPFNRKGETLTINNIQQNEIVNCTARNTMVSSSNNSVSGFRSISKKINVLYGATVTSLTVNVSETLNNDIFIVEENDSLSISCVVDSKPPSTIRIFKGVELLSQELNTLELVYNIPSANCSHTSEYDCKAWNGYEDSGPSEKTLQLNIKCSPSPDPGANPIVFARLDSSAKLLLTVHSYPPPTRHAWYRNISDTWNEVQNSSSVQSTWDMLQFSLVIKSVKVTDYGEYKLTVENGNGDPLNYVFVLRPQGKF